MTPDIKNNNKEVEDIFEGVREKAPLPFVKTAPLGPKREIGQMQVEDDEKNLKIKSSGARVFTKIIIILAAVLLVGAVGYTIWQKFFNDASNGNTNTAVIVNSGNQNANKQLNQNSSSVNSQNTNTLNLNTAAPDSDKDGLSDKEEIELGTSISKVDTDLDGLYDYEEVKVYLTDPLNPDTDGDGYKDGEEVKSGYNPKGSGKLFDLNQVLKNTNGK